MIWQLAVVCTLALMPAVSHACRCAQQPLGTYYERAHAVLIARLAASTQEDDRRILDFELLGTPHKGEADKRRTDTLRLGTARSSATCGIQPVADAVYVLFTNRIEDSEPGQWVDTCSGTRVLLSPDGSQPQGFVDVPPRFVLQQLNGLAGMDVLRDVAANAPSPEDHDNVQLVGLLDLKAFAHGGFMDVHEGPDATTQKIARIDTYEQVRTKEVGYEQPAAIVYARLPQWYRIRLGSDSFGWVAAAESGTYFAYAELPVRRLAYLNEHWSGFLWPDAGAGLPMRHERARDDARHEYPVNVLESKIVGGMPWFRVELLSEICTGLEEKVLLSGWVPGYGRSGKPGVWFFSRGC
jgi:hypothetical protein